MECIISSCKAHTPTVEHSLKTFIPATEPPDPRRVSEGFQKGSLKGSLKGFKRVFEGVSRRTLQNPFKNPSKTLQEGVEIDDALGFPRL